MAEIVGVVRFISTLDGRNMDREAEKAGEKAGKAGAKGYDKEWQAAFRKTLSKSGQESFDRWTKAGSRDGGAYGKVFSESLEQFITRGTRRAADAVTKIRLQPGFLDDFARGFQNADAAAEDLNEQLRLMEGRINGNVLRAARTQVDEWAAAQRRAADETDRLQAAAVRQRAAFWDAEEATERASVAMTRLDRSARAAATSSEGLDLHWRNLSHNTRQWTLIIGAVAAALQDIAVLGSAAGAGLAAIGGAATSGIAGIGGVAAVFATLAKDAEELPPHLRSVKAEFDRLKPVFGELREAVATGAFSEMGGTFDQIGRNLRSLNPELAELGRSVGRVFDDFAEGTRAGSEGLEEIRRALRLAGPNFESMAGSAGTFGVALLRTFNRAQPLVQDLLRYVDTLAKRLDSFSRGSGFDEWMRNAQRTFGSLGPLLDATGRMLNDLVTAESVNRTAAFLDNLTAFMPALGTLLDILGSADVFGLLAQALNEAGQALAPLAPAVDDLVTALSAGIAAALPGIADAISAVATIIAPLVQHLADFIDAIPPDLIYAAAGAVTVLGGAFLALRSVAGALVAIEGFTAAAGAATSVTGRLGNSLKANLGKAGLVGVAVVGVFALVEGIGELSRQILDLDDRTRNLVASQSSLANAAKEFDPEDVGGQYRDLAQGVEYLDEAIGGLGPQLGLVFDTMNEGKQAGLALASTLRELDEPLAALANQSLAAASEQFATWAKEVDASEAEVLTMIEAMPQFKAALEQAALAEGDLATDADLVRLALDGANLAADAQTQALEGVATQAGLTDEQITGLADGIKGFSDTVYASRDAAREYEAAIDNLSDSITENGTTLDINTAQGRANEAAVDDLAQSVLNNAAATVKNTGDQEAARQEMERGRAKLVEMLQQFGLTEQAANDYADELGLIPENIPTDVQLNGVKEAEDAINNLVRRRQVVINAAIGQGGAWTPGVDRPFASGGTVYGPTRALIGEAGVEAVVPLERPLSQVDPSVRWLAAIAQGKATPAMASGGIAGVGGGYNIAEGAIVVEDRSGDPRRTGNEVLQRIIENVVG